MIVWLATVTPTLIAAGGNDVPARPDCQFTRPPDWDQTWVAWEGECRDGMAHGPGVLRGYDDGQAKRIFFGVMNNGDLDIGVIEIPEGYIAGQFLHGNIQRNTDRNMIIKAFQEASLAAAIAAGRFRASGKDDSAEFYARKSRELSQQME